MGPIFSCGSVWTAAVEEIDAYTTEKGWRYVTSADRTPEVRLRIIAAFHTLY